MQIHLAQPFPLQNALLTASSCSITYAHHTCYSWLPGSSQMDSEAATPSSHLIATPLQHLHQVSEACC